jgi:hypothetical protein
MIEDERDRNPRFYSMMVFTQTPRAVSPPFEEDRTMDLAILLPGDGRKGQKADSPLLANELMKRSTGAGFTSNTGDNRHCSAPT